MGVRRWCLVSMTLWSLVVGACTRGTPPKEAEAPELTPDELAYPQGRGDCTPDPDYEENASSLPREPEADCDGAEPGCAEATCEEGMEFVEGEGCREVAMEEAVEDFWTETRGSDPEPSELPKTGKRDPGARRQIERAMDEYFLQTDFGRAEQVLVLTRRACEGQCSARVLATLWMYMFVVNVAQDQPKAMSLDSARRARHLDPQVSLDELFATEAMRLMWREAESAP